MNSTRFFFLTLLLAAISQLVFAQEEFPILKSNSPVISIKDGGEFRKDYWELDPEARPDIYEADRINAVKKVTYYSDIDTLTFELSPGEKYDFVILLNGTDSCFNHSNH